MNEWSPIVSEFDSAEAYDLWLRAKVAQSLADDSPVIRADQVMVEIRSIIAAKRSGKPRC